VPASKQREHSRFRRRVFPIEERQEEGKFFLFYFRHKNEKFHFPPLLNIHSFSTPRYFLPHFARLKKRRRKNINSSLTVEEIKVAFAG
jgi:hypothetical protein